MGVQEGLAQLKDTTSFFNGEYNAKSVTITICCALAFYNALELILLILTTFRKYSGLYFWSLLIASVGIIPYTIGFMIEYFQLTAQLAGEIITTFGWPMMVTGQSFVLYSRLGVVLGATHHGILKAVKWMIIVDGLVFHISTSIVVFGTYNSHPNHSFAQAYKYIEKVQMTGFTIQEFILSALYVWRTLDILKTGRNRRRNRVMRELLGINIFIVIMDIALLVVEYQNRHVIEQAIKQVVYSVKLKLEFAILSKLVGITQHNGADHMDILDDYRPESYKITQDETLGLPPFQSDSQMEKDKLGDKTLHIERTSSWLSDTTCNVGTALTKIHSLPDTTCDERRRRRTLEEDLYADAIRNVGG